MKIVKTPDFGNHPIHELFAAANRIYGEKPRYKIVWVHYGNLIINSLIEPINIAAFHESEKYLSTPFGYIKVHD